MKVLLDTLVPRLFPTLDFLCVPHDGKQDLEKSIPRKLKAWREPNVRFVVIRDNDRGDCLALKDKLRKLCEDAGREDVLIRIACQELEAWYFGDMDQLGRAFDTKALDSLQGKERFRDPDSLARPAAELRALIPSFQKIAGARLMGERLEREGNTSRSFRVLLEGIERLVPVVSESPTTDENGEPN